MTLAKDEEHPRILDYISGARRSSYLRTGPNRVIEDCWFSEDTV